MGMVGILGAGQLGRMLALAGYPLGLRFRFFDPAPDAAAGLLAEHIVADYDDQESLSRFADGLDLVTYEFENVPVAAARYLGRSLPVYPSPVALETAQDRLEEKKLFRELGIPTPDFYPVGSRADLEAGLGEIGFPAVLKTRRLGYDGKGQIVLGTSEDIDPGSGLLSRGLLILEQFVPFQREVSILSVRGKDGEMVFYPLVENWHYQGILRFSLAPAPDVTPDLQNQAEDIARTISERLAYTGILAVELFQVDGALWVNEIAPRVHNSGHWTIEGAETSQFANHLRAVMGWSLGCAAAKGLTAMINLIGSASSQADLLDIDGLHLHLYDKTPRPGRKIGHVNLCFPEMQNLKTTLDRVRKTIAAPGMDKFLERVGRYA